MKKILLLALLAIDLSFSAAAQIVFENKSPGNYIEWYYEIRKIGKDSFKVAINATLDEGWHIFTQDSTAMGIGTNTKIEVASWSGGSFPDLNLPFRENGRLVTIPHSRIAGIVPLPYYEKSVTFHNIVRVVGSRTVIYKIHFQLCYKEEKCLPPADLYVTLKF